MVAVYNRHLERALHVFKYSGCEDPVVATTQEQLEDAIRRGKPAVTEDAFLLAQ